MAKPLDLSNGTKSHVNLQAYEGSAGLPSHFHVKAGAMERFPSPLWTWPQFFCMSQQSPYIKGLRIEKWNFTQQYSTIMLLVTAILCSICIFLCHSHGLLAPKYRWSEENRRFAEGHCFGPHPSGCLCPGGKPDPPRGHMGHQRTTKMSGRTTLVEW